MSAGTNVEQIIEARLRELDDQLRPLAELEEENSRLLQALEALRGGAADNGRAPASRSAGKATPARRARQRSGRDKRATRGSNLEAILEYVRRHPGATASDLASATSISRGVVYSAVSRLTAAGRLRREQLPDGQVAYHLPA
jgi:hypothetical protein